MKKTVIYGIVGVVVLAVAAAGAHGALRSRVDSSPLLDGATPRDAIYTIDNSPVALQNGYLSVPVAADQPDTRIVTRYFGNEAEGDLNDDGVPDVGAIITQEPGGSGTFFYAVAAIKTPNGYRGTNAVLLGDRIAPQTLSIENGLLTVNYADRKPDEPMVAKPSVAVSKRLVVHDGKLIEQ
jgi:hypothetical protein